MAALKIFIRLSYRAECNSIKSEAVCHQKIKFNHDKDAMGTSKWMIIVLAIQFVTEHLDPCPSGDAMEDGSGQLLFLQIQNTQEIKRTLFNWTKQDKMCKFLRCPLFQATYNTKTEKQSMNSTYLLPASHIKPTQVEFIVCFSGFFVVVACSLKKRASSKISMFRRVLSD